MVHSRLFKCYNDHPVYTQTGLCLLSTSKWKEAYLTPIHCVFLEKLPPTRIIPAQLITSDEDINMQKVLRTLSATENEVRAGKFPSQEIYGFYLKLASVIHGLFLRDSSLYPSRNVRSGRGLITRYIFRLLSPIVKILPVRCRSW